MTQLTLEIIAKTLFDADVHHEASDAGAALAAAQESFLERFQSFMPLPEWVPTPGTCASVAPFESSMPSSTASSASAMRVTRRKTIFCPSCCRLATRTAPHVRPPAA